MATIVHTEVTCDGPLSKHATEISTVPFVVDGRALEIDLCSTCADKFSSAVQPYRDAARHVVEPVRKSLRTASDRNRTAAIRTWAQGAGLTTNKRGRLPETIVAKYEAAHKG